MNADDLGWTEGVNRGIAEAHRNGIVTSASLLANGAAFASGVEVARKTPGLGVGVHLNLSDGEPVAPRELVKSLVNERGELEGRTESLLLRLARRSVLLDEVEREWEAQIQKVRTSGIEPTHLDGHRHVQMLPGLFEIALRLAKRHGIAAIRISHEESSLRAALSAGAKQKGTVVMRQGVQARGLKLLATGCARTSGTRGDCDGGLFLRNRADWRADAGRSPAAAGDFAGGHDGADVPSGICGRGPGKIGDAAAGIRGRRKWKS